MIKMPRKDAEKLFRLHSKQIEQNLLAAKKWQILTVWGTSPGSLTITIKINGGAETGVSGVVKGSTRGE